MKISGVYKIQSIKHPERCYIGSAKSIHSRWLIHLRDLRRNKHHSSKLQRHYNKYGLTDLSFAIMIGCDKDDLITTEQFFLDLLNPYFNTCKKAYSCFGRVLSDETKEKIRQKKLGVPLSEYHKQRCSEGQKNGRHPIRTKEWNEKIAESNRGLKRSIETRQKQSKLKKGKPPWNKGKVKINGEYVCPN